MSTHEPKSLEALEGPLPELELDDERGSRPGTDASRNDAYGIAGQGIAGQDAGLAPLPELELDLPTTAELKPAGPRPTTPGAKATAAGATAAGPTAAGAQRTGAPAPGEPPTPGRPGPGRPSAASLPGGVVVEMTPLPHAQSLDGAPPDESAEAQDLAGYGKAPAGFVAAGLYTARVYLKRRALREELAQRRRSASEAARAIERRVLRLGQELGASSQDAGSLGAVLGQVRQLQSAGAAEAAGASLAHPRARLELEQALLALGRRALADATASTEEVVRARADLAALERASAARARDVRVRELALVAFDPAAFARGRIVLGVLAALLLFAFFSPALRHCIAPAPVESLPPDDVRLSP